MMYELWNEASGNRIEGFEGELGLARLLEIVREIAELQGPQVVDTLFIEVWSSLEAPEPEAIIPAERLRQLLEPQIRTYAFEVPLAPATKSSQSTVIQELAPAV